MKALRTIFALICVAVLASSCGSKEPVKYKELIISFNTTEITLIGTKPVEVTYSARDYNGPVTVENGFYSLLGPVNFKIDNKFDSNSGQGVLSFTQTEIQKATHIGSLIFTDGVNSVKKGDIYVYTKTE